MRSRYVLIACLAVVLAAAPAMADSEPMSVNQHITMTVMPEDMLSIDVQEHLHFHIMAGEVHQHGFGMNFMNTTSTAWEITVLADHDLYPIVDWVCPEGEPCDDHDRVPVYDETNAMDIGVLTIVFDPAPPSDHSMDWAAEGIVFYDQTMSTTDAQVIVTGDGVAKGGWGLGYHDHDDHGEQLWMELDLIGISVDHWIDHETHLVYTIQHQTGNGG